MYFFDRNEEFKNNIMCVDDTDAQFTYKQIWDMGDDLIESVPKRSLVLLLCANDAVCLSTYMALLRKRCIVMLLGQNMDTGLIGGMIDNYKPEFIIGPEAVTDTLREEAGNPDGGFVKSGKNGDYVLCSMPVSEHAYKADPELGLLLSTSGSTGAQKLVRLSYDNLQSNCDSIVEYLGLTSAEKPITTLPMEYTYGLSVLHSHTAVGAKMILTKYTVFSPVFWYMVEKYHVTSMAGVPYTYDMLERLRFTTMQLPFLTSLTQAGGHLNTDMHQKIGKWARMHKVKFFVMYGQTEATARMSYIPPEKCLDKIGSIGIPVPGGRIELLDEENNPIEDTGVSGELIYYGPNVSLGYATCREDLAKADERQGRLETGDIAYRDEDGYFFITGRKKRFIKLYGKRTSLDQIQELLQEAFGTPEIICAGDDETGVRVYTSEDSVMDRLEEMEDFFWDKWKIRSNMVTLKKLDAIPRNDSGKIKYTGL